MFAVIWVQYQVGDSHAWLSWFVIIFFVQLQFECKMYSPFGNSNFICTRNNRVAYSKKWARETIPSSCVSNERKATSLMLRSLRTIEHMEQHMAILKRQRRLKWIAYAHASTEVHFAGESQDYTNVRQSECKSAKIFIYEPQMHPFVCLKTSIMP